MPRVDIKDPDASVMTGFPGDGDSIDGNPAPQPPADPPAPQSADEIKALRERLERTESELAQLRRQPPVVPKDPPAPPKEADVDWDQEFFASPKKALAAHAEMIEKRVTERLTSQYQRDRSTQSFWEGFYEKHPDLKKDHDLVDLTLKSNLAEMSAMPVATAMERLADLTRERILRYAGGHKPRAPKAHAEGAGGAGGVSKPSAPSKEEKILSISDLIRQRKDSRRRAAGA